MDSKTEPASEAKERFKKNANDWISRNFGTRDAYIAGATAEHNRAQEEITRLKAENEELGKMYANASAKLRDLQKEYSDTKANLYRAYNGLENYKQVKAELERERELRRQILKGLESLDNLYYAGYKIYPNDLKPLIEKSKLK